MEGRDHRQLESHDSRGAEAHSVDARSAVVRRASCVARRASCVARRASRGARPTSHVARPAPRAVRRGRLVRDDRLGAL
ncbi:hypothetical protein SZ60_12345, partial [Frigoribacterium sp. MEB024]